MRHLPPLSLPVRLAYGVGELAAAIPASLSAFFLLYFFTTVAGLSPALAGGILLIGRLWDSINDPIIGWLSDHTVSPLGRRFPWMLAGVVPFAICVTLLWTVPNLGSQWGLFGFYAVLSLFAFVAVTAVQLPYTALAAELSEDYDERTGLVGMKSAFSIGGSIFAMVLAQIVFARWDQPKQQYFILGSIAAVLALITIVICVAGTYRRYWLVQKYRPVLAQTGTTPSLLTELRRISRNSAFRTILGIYICGWMGIQITAAMLPYFVDDWMGLSEIHFAQMALAVLGTAMVMILVWTRVARYSGKRTVFMLGAPLAMLGLFGLYTVQPGQLVWMYTLGAVTGAGVATLYMVPFAMLPDVIDLDELQTGLRREGLYFSAIVFLQKLGLAAALFLSGQLLALTGYTTTAVTQPATTLLTIRLLMGPLPAVFILFSLIFAAQYPITRTRHQEILMALQEKRRQSSAG